MTPQEFRKSEIARLGKKGYRSAYSKGQRKALYRGDADKIRQQFDVTYGLAAGGPAMAGQTYNINELGPENYYSGGAMTRTGQPRTIQPSSQGYVRPNGAAIARYAGGQVGPRFDNGGPITSGGYNDQVGGGPVQPSTGYTGSDFAQSYGGEAGPPQENPGGVEGGFNFMTDPGYQFRKDEGMRGLERGAAARGGLLSGGFGKAAIRYGQDYATKEYTNVYNRIANIAGLGQVSADSSGQYAMYGGQGMGNAAANQGMGRASGHIAQGNIWQNTIGGIAGQDWGGVFGGSQPKPTAPGGTTYNRGF
jgi:hypothetical protein